MAASFTLEKIQSLLHEKGIYSKLAEEWDHFGSTVDVPQSKRDEIRHSLHMDNGARLGCNFEYLVSMHPYGSWRLLIWALDEMGTNYKHYAAAIRDSAEPVERSLTKDEVLAILKKSSLLKSHAKLDHLANILLVPSSQKGESFKTVSERAEVVIEYWCNTLYNASWATLAGALFYLAEKKELVDEVKMKIQSIPHSTSNVIVCDDLQAAARSILKDSEELCKMLNIPHKAGTVDTRFVPDAEIEAKKKKMFEVYISSHPSPSWRQFALSLYRLKEHDSLKALYNSQLPGPDKLRNYDAYQRALETEDNYDIIIMQGVMTGFPRSGKTSLMAKLTHKAIESDPLSTGVAERVELINMTQPIAAEEEEGAVLRKTTPGSIIVTRQMHWKSASMGQEIATALNQIASSTRPSNTDSRPANPPPLASPTATETPTLADPSPPVEKKGKGHRRSSSIANFLKVSVLKRIRKKAVVTAPPAAIPSGVPPSHLLLAKGMESDAVSEVLWTLYLSDVGGQPEFQELLAAVVSGPTMFFVVFPLHLPLDQLYRIDHLDTGNAKMKPYQSSLTMREAILQSLASITSTAIIREGKRVLPKILFVGTHKDKLNPATRLDDIGKIDQDLFQMVKKTEAYNMDVIIRASQSQMIFTVNNKESSEHIDFQQIRTTIQKIGLENNSIYKVSIPGSWMLLALYLRYKVEQDGLQVYSYDECFEDAQNLGIKSKDDLNGALWFFHYHLGIVRHYQEIPELRHRIIADSQHIFNRVTTVIKKTFSYTKAGSSTKLEEKGIFSRDALIEHLSTQSQDITPQELLALLEYLYITAKLEQRGKSCEYFLPCALQHAPKPKEHGKEEPQDSLLFTFTCGFCPRGIFGALVVHVLKRMENENLEYGWNLEKDTIFRNQFSMKIGPHRDIFQFTLLPKYIRIDVYPSKLKVRAVPLSKVCCHVRSEMEHGLETVSCKLSYNGSKSQPTFLCPQSHASPYPVETAFYKGVPSVLDCSIHEDVRQREVDEKHLIWFPSGIREKTTPSVKELTESLISVAHKWEELAMQLEVPKNIRSDINKTASSSGEKLYTLLEHWCQKGESLQEIVEALKSELMSEQALAAKFQETYNIP